MIRLPPAGNRPSRSYCDFAAGAEKLASYKVPAEIVFTPEPFVRNAVGKIDKPLLRRGYAA